MSARAGTRVARYAVVRTIAIAMRRWIRTAHSVLSQCSRGRAALAASLVICWSAPKVRYETAPLKSITKGARLE